MNERDQVIERALRERRISASQVGEYRRIYDAQPVVMKHLLTASKDEGGLMPGLMAFQDNIEASTQYDESWLTAQERVQLEARRAKPPVASPPAAQTAARTAAAPEQVSARVEDEYDEAWLNPKRQRLAAARDGTFVPGPARPGPVRGRRREARRRERDCGMTERDARIVKRSRLFRLLADRPEYMKPDREERFAALDHKVVAFVSPVDAESIEDATDLDRLCGAAVRRLGKRADAGVVDLLGWLDEDRLSAVALALPEDRRETIVGSDFVWLRAWSSVDMDAVREVETLIRDLDAAWKGYDDHLRLVQLDPEELTGAARRFVSGLPAAL